VNGSPVYDTIENIYAKYGDGTHAVIEVASMKNNEVIWSRAEQIYRHPANAKLYKILTETGREIIVTENHSLIVLDQNSLQPKTTKISDLSTNEMVPVTRRIPDLNINNDEIDILKYVKGSDVVVEDNKEEPKQQKISQKKMSTPVKKSEPVEEDVVEEDEEDVPKAKKNIKF